MPQGPISVADANLIPQGAKNALNLTAATLVKGAPGTLLAVSVIVAGSAAGKVNDVATVGGVAAGNQILAVPNAVGPMNGLSRGLSFSNGLVVTPGTGQTVAVFYI